MRHHRAGVLAGPIAALALGVASAAVLAALIPGPGRPYTALAGTLRALSATVALAAVTARTQAEPNATPLTANLTQP